MKIVVGSDPWGYELKTAVKAHLTELGHEVLDVGGQTAEDPCPYWETAGAAARALQEGRAERGFLFCGTGMGMSIVANKFKGIVAAVVESDVTAGLCRAINNANVLTMGGLLMTPFTAVRATDAFLNTAHTQGFEMYADFLKTACAEVGRLEEGR